MATLLLAPFVFDLRAGVLAGEPRARVLRVCVGRRRVELEASYA